MDCIYIVFFTQSALSAFLPLIHPFTHTSSNKLPCNTMHTSLTIGGFSVSLDLPPANIGSLVNYYSSPFFYSAGITKAASKLSLRQEVRQQEAPPAVKPAVPTVSSYPSNGQIHSQYHGYYVKADVKIPPPEEPVGVEDDLHPSSLARLPPPAKEIQAPALRFLPPSSPLPVPPKDSPKAPEPPKPKRQESTKPKSLTETKKASVEIVPEIVEEDMVS